MAEPQALPDDEEVDVEVGASLTQAQVNAIVKDRLTRQKAREARERQAMVSELSTSKEKLALLEQANSQYQEIFSKMLAEKRKGVPEGVLALLDKLSPAEQLAWIESNATAKPVPQTPKPQGSEVSPEETVVRKRNSGMYSI